MKDILGFNPPSNMVEVSGLQFYSLLKKDKRDIMPSIREPYFTTWETKSREVWGWSWPGWKNPTNCHGDRYFVKREAKND